MSKSSRRLARIIAFQIVYQRQKIGIQEDGESFLVNQTSINADHLRFCRELTEKTWNSLNEIDAQIKIRLQGWRQDRITVSLNALLRVSIAELMFFQDTDGKIVLNEAIEICKTYVDKEATGILNGVLHAVWNDLKQGE